MLHIQELQKIIKQLRAPDGCPWDKKQTPESLIKYLKEETEELTEAIQAKDVKNICEEIGDVVYVLLMLTEIFEENELFNFTDSLQSISEKLIRRHPHVFENTVNLSESELRQQWESIKNSEKQEKN